MYSSIVAIFQLQNFQCHLATNNSYSSCITDVYSLLTTLALRTTVLLNNDIVSGVSFCRYCSRLSPMQQAVYLCSAAEIEKYKLFRVQLSSS